VSLRTSPDNAWPRGRGTTSSLVAQFGSDRADLFRWALNGLDSLSDPPDSVVALLTHTERLPDYADDELLDHGSAPFYTMPPGVHLISLRAGALVRVYESPSIAAVLTSTGRLVDGAERRIRETGKWVATAMLPGSLRVGQPGYVATLQVRAARQHAPARPRPRVRRVRLRIAQVGTYPGTRLQSHIDLRRDVKSRSPSVAGAAAMAAGHPRPAKRGPRPAARTGVVESQVLSV
jgi:hypothetical protein